MKRSIHNTIGCACCGKRLTRKRKRVHCVKVCRSLAKARVKPKPTTQARGAQ